MRIRRNTSKLLSPQENDGIVAIEFAVIFPFLLLVLYGAYTISTNILLARKFDNAINDIAYITSRLGRIANDSVDTNGNCPPTGCVGGKDTLEKSINYLMPILLYPLGKSFELDPNSPESRGKYAYEIKIAYIGIPKITDPDPSIPKNEIRLMWMHDIRSKNNHFEDGGYNVRLGNGSEFCVPLQQDIKVGGVPQKSSTMRMKFDGVIKPLATLNSPGQGQIIVFGRLGKNTIKRGNWWDDEERSLVPNFLLDFGTFFKISSYAVRSSWKDGYNGAPRNNNVEPGEFVNEMHYCTDCGSNNSWLSLIHI